MKNFLKSISIPISISILLNFNTGFAFSLFNNKNQTQVTCGPNPSTQGYRGTLPDLNKTFDYLKDSEKNNFPFSSSDKINNNNLLKAPKYDPQYLNLILKERKKTKYTSDLNDILKILEKLKLCCKNKPQDIRAFNALVASLIDNVNYLQRLYHTKPESKFVTYSSLIKLANQGYEIANLRATALIYSKYLSYSNKNAKYKPENINRQISNFAKNINNTIYLINQEK